MRRVIEKPRQLPNMLKGCGLYLFDLAIFDAIRHTPRTAMRDEYELTDSIQILIDYDYPVRVAPIVDWDINVTYIGDLIRCSTHVLRKSGVSHLIGERASVAEGTDLIDSVVGDGAVVAQPARFERCVIMPGATVNGAGPYSDCVITQEGVLKACPGIARKE